MEVRSISRYIRQSPKKVRIVLDKIRGKKVGYALDYLHFSPLKASYVDLLILISTRTAILRLG